jgi:hypothetical protein
VKQGHDIEGHDKEGHDIESHDNDSERHDIERHDIARDVTHAATMCLPKEKLLLCIHPKHTGEPSNDPHHDRQPPFSAT